MPGSSARRFCDRCGKHVHALADMTALEAEDFIASAPPGGLCVRVEHDEDGAVRFKPAGPDGAAPRPRPLLRIAVGASLLVASSCRAEPTGAPAPSVQAAGASVQAPAEARRGGAAEAQAEAAFPAEADAGAPSPAPTSTPAGPDAAPKNGDRDPGATRRVTMGCLCAPGDALCSCL
jgi:hypothetical protein